ncbi:MAG: hypothetical protein M3R62_11110 [Acidobacteriota bacterium]|nr:hypothetical protein [Acidobacteriota bacterium]
MTDDGVLDGLTDPRVLGLERHPIRTRESGVTLSAWRLSVRAEEGEGSILRLESPAAEPLLRGDGLFLGWDQPRLRAAYEALEPRDDSPPFETQQLG